jgi:hypothetical protein
LVLLNTEDTKTFRNVGKLSNNNAVTHPSSPEFTGTPRSKGMKSRYTLIRPLLAWQLLTQNATQQWLRIVQSTQYHTVQLW